MENYILNFLTEAVAFNINIKVSIFLKCQFLIDSRLFYQTIYQCNCFPSFWDICKTQYYFDSHWWGSSDQIKSQYNPDTDWLLSAGFINVSLLWIFYQMNCKQSQNLKNYSLEEQSFHTRSKSLKLHSNNWKQWTKVWCILLRLHVKLVCLL